MTRMSLQDLDAQLTPRTYLVSNYFTAADVALYGALHPIFVSFLFVFLFLMFTETNLSCIVSATARAILLASLPDPLLRSHPSPPIH